MDTLKRISAVLFKLSYSSQRCLELSLPHSQVVAKLWKIDSERPFHLNLTEKNPIWDHWSINLFPVPFNLVTNYFHSFEHCRNLLNTEGKYDARNKMNWKEATSADISVKKSSLNFSSSSSCDPCYSSLSLIIFVPLWIIIISLSLS